MRDEVYSCIIEEIRKNKIQVPKLPLYMQAEPFADPKIIYRINEAKERIGGQVGRIELSTNGIFLDERKSKQLLEVSDGIDMTVWLSFNGTTREEYARINQLPFERVLDNILGFLKSSDDTRITRKIMTSTDERRVRSFWKRLAAERGIKRLPILKIFKPNNRGGNTKAGGAVSKESWQGCVRPRKWLHFNWAGDAIICCNDYENEVIFGNIMDIGIKKIVERIPKVMAQASKQEDFICNRCSKRYK